MTGSLIAVWKGPFTNPELHALEARPYPVRITAPNITTGGSTTVTTSTASQMASADMSWWTFH